MTDTGSTGFAHGVSRREHGLASQSVNAIADRASSPCLGLAGRGKEANSTTHTLKKDTR